MAPGERPGDGQTAERLLAMIRSLNLQFPTRTLVLLFDEVDALDMKMRDGTLSSEVTSFLGSLLESDCRMARPSSRPVRPKEAASADRSGLCLRRSRSRAGSVC